MTTDLEHSITTWYATRGRDLPWRHPGIAAWPVMVSEFMLQQTPVTRVLPAYREWLARWPTAGALASATPADAVRQWDRLGYPRRAIRLHQSASIIAAKHAGQVPQTITELRELPGVGSYTAAAVASFAFGQRHAVLDTNVRRVLARLISGHQHPATSVSPAEQALAETLLPPEHDRRAATWSVALMELGALVCTATRPTCGNCPVADRCAWLSGGAPAGIPPRRGKPYPGSDRECRGKLLAVLRTANGPVPPGAFDGCWPEPAQRERMVEALIADGLAVRLASGHISLPGESTAR